MRRTVTHPAQGSTLKADTAGELKSETKVLGRESRAGIKKPDSHVCFQWSYEYSLVA